MAFDFSTLITDRTLEDVAARNEKGSYNATDLNRVDACLDDLVARLSRVGCNVPGYKRVKIERAVTPSSRLPEGYTELEYIQSSGTQYMDSGLALNKSDSYTYSILAQFSNDAYGGANGYMQFMSGIASGAKATIKVVYDGETHVERVYVDDTQKSQTDWTSACNGINVKIGILKMGDQNNGWFSGTPQIGKIFALTILNGGNLIRDFVPCIDPTGAVGLYDLIGQKFYGNTGSGSFAAGPVVTWEEPEEPAETMDPYTWYESDVPTVSLLARYRDNVAAVRAALRLPEGTPGVPETMRRLTTAEANSIEAVLLAVDLILNNIPAAVRHCGVTVCGSKGVIA